MSAAPDLIAENVQAVFSIVLIAVLVALRPVVKQPQLRKDGGGAIKYFVVSLGAHLAASLCAAIAQLELAGGHPDAAHLRSAANFGSAESYLDLLGLLFFTFGVVRTCVGLTIWLFRSRRGVPTPQIVRSVVDGVLYAICLFLVLRARVKDLTSLLATSAAFSVVVGLALQETLGNFFAGLSLQMEHPFQVGDWVAVNEFVGRVVQVAWRGTKLETLRQEQVTVPNSVIAKANVVNYSRHGTVARDLTLGVSYRSPPNLVKAALREVLVQVPEVLNEPAPFVHVLRFDDSQVTYLLRFFVRGFEQAESAVDAVLSAVWYRFKRDGLEIPFPQRTIQLERVAAQRNVLVGAEDYEDTLELLGTVDFLRPLGNDGRAELARRVRRELFGVGEVILRAGDAGDSFYVVASGEVAVRAKAGDKEQEVARLKRGEFFGEMSLLTGEPRAATVVAAGDATLLVMSRAAFAQVLAHHHTVAQELADILGRRRAELDKALADADSGNAARAESRRIFGRLRELFKVAD